MRLAKVGEDLAGKVCLSTKGLPFIVTGIHSFSWGTNWVGLDFDDNEAIGAGGGGVLSESREEYDSQIIEKESE